MTFKLREVEHGRLYASIVEQILEGIRTSAFRPGEALPAERALAEQLAVSRSSVREAIRVLEHAGVVEVRTGSGTYVTDAALFKAAALRAQAALIGEQSPLDIMVARRALEPLCAELASQQRRKHDLVALQAALGEQESQIAHCEDPISADLRFHRAIATATHNPVLEMLVDRILDVMRQDTWRELKRRTLRSNEGTQTYLSEHRQILDSIDSQQAAWARQAMTAHLDSVEFRLLDLVP